MFLGLFSNTEPWLADSHNGNFPSNNEFLRKRKVYILTIRPENWAEGNVIHRCRIQQLQSIECSEPHNYRSSGWTCEKQCERVRKLTVHLIVLIFSLLLDTQLLQSGIHVQLVGLQLPQEGLPLYTHTHTHTHTRLTGSLFRPSRDKTAILVSPLI